MDLSNNITIIALGGSIIVSKKIQVEYLRRLCLFIHGQLAEGRKFILVVGGGSTARNYQQAASAIISIEDEDKDWLGIHSTRINAHLLRTIFADCAYPVVLDNPNKTISQRDFKKYALYIASGWRPGWSTDYIAMRFAYRFRAPRVIVATTIPYVYTKDIMKKGALPLKRLSWKAYERLLPKDYWVPGMKVPVDPVATAFAKKHNISCVVLRGTNLQNLKRYLDDKSFEGSLIG